MDSETATATVVKKIQEANENNDKVQKNQKVSGKMRIWRCDEDRENSIEQSVVTGANQLSREVESIMLTMKVGDIWQIQVSNKILQKQENMNLQILSVQQIPQTQDILLSAEQRAQNIKAAGNAFIQSKNYEKAIESYVEAYELIKYSCDQKTVDLKLSIVSNLALATLNSGKFGECINWCSIHIKESLEANKKVIYRQASAQKGLKEWKSAKETIEKALEWWKGDKDTEGDFKGLLDILVKQEKIQKQKQTKVFKKMFG